MPSEGTVGWLCSRLNCYSLRNLFDIYQALTNGQGNVGVIWWERMEDEGTGESVSTYRGEATAGRIPHVGARGGRREGGC